jgi:galactose mutarotase-like enzyme
MERLDEALTVPENGRTVLDTPKHRIIIEQDPKVFKYVQFYLPPDKASIAIEPFTSAANSFNLPFLGLDALEPGQSLSGLIRVRTGVWEISKRSDI